MVPARLGVPDPPAVLQLEEHLPAGLPHRLGDPPSPGHVRVVVDRGDVGVRGPTALGVAAASAMISPAEVRWA